MSEKNANNFYDEYGQAVLEAYENDCDWAPLLFDLNIKIEKNEGDRYRIKGDNFPELGDPGTNDSKIAFYNDDMKLYDFDTGKTYNPIQVTQMRLGLNQDEAINYLAQKKGIPTKYEEQPTYDELNNHINSYNNNLLSDKFKVIREDLYSRGLNDEYIKSHKIGFRQIDRRIILPHLLGNRAHYFIARKLSKETFNKFYPNDNYDEFYSNDNYGNESKYKKANIKKYRANGSDVIPYLPYNYNSALKAKYEIYITEGYFDSDTLVISHKANICLCSTRTKKITWDKYIIPAIKDKRVILLGDNDYSGINALLSWIDEYLIPNKIYNFFVEIIPHEVNDTERDFNILYEDYFKRYKKDKEEAEKAQKEKKKVEKDPDSAKGDFFDNKSSGNNQVKDINDFYLTHDNSIKLLKKTRINGFAYIAGIYKKLHPEAYFNRFYYDYIEPIKRQFTESQVRSIIKDIKKLKIFTDEEISILEERLNKIPTQAEITDSIMKKFEGKLIYDIRKEYKIFTGKVWETRPVEGLNPEIIEELGDRFKDGNKLKPINNLIRFDKRIISYDSVFNKSDLVVFNNGTLYLNNGEPKFRYNYFNPDDRMSQFCNFDYDEKAECPNFLKYLDSALTINDPEDTKRKILMLQEYLGYSLFPDYPKSLQYCLVLQGDNSNGKSTLIDLLEKIFSEEAVSHVEIPALEKETERIALKDSFINIAEEENKSSMFGRESLIKKLTTGATIRGRDLYKSAVEFKSRAKWIISANNDFTIADKSGATDRRLLFLRFPYSFIPPNDKRLKLKNGMYKPLDEELESKLDAEKAGVFNWILDGYKRLKKNLHFTISQEHTDKIKEFKQNNNPVADFICHTRFIRRTTNYDKDHNLIYYCLGNEAFLDFIQYLTDGNYSTDWKEKTFITELRRTLRSLGFDFKEETYRFDRKTIHNKNIRVRKNSTRIFIINSIPEELTPDCIHDYDGCPTEEYI